MKTNFEKKTISLLKITFLVKYAEDENGLVIYIEKKDKNEVDYWKSQINRLADLSDRGRQLYKNCGSDLRSVFE